MLGTSKMTEDRIARMQKQILKLVMGELQGFMNDLLKDALDPRKLMAFIRSIGIDISQLPGMVSQQPAFDPYQILGLDKSASDEEVKKRYRLLVHKLHPDTAGIEGTSFLLQMVLAAYELIKKMRGWH
ncbi:Chaperone protein DnaJ [subsurface metagenome]